jgi:hypothetical protein
MSSLPRRFSRRARRRHATRTRRAVRSQTSPTLRFARESDKGTSAKTNKQKESNLKLRRRIQSVYRSQFSHQSKANAIEPTNVVLRARRAALAVVPTVISGGQTEPQPASVHCVTKPLNALVCPTHADNSVIAPHAENHASKHGHRSLPLVSSEMHASSRAEHPFSNSSAVPLHWLCGNNVDETDVRANSLSDSGFVRTTVAVVVRALGVVSRVAAAVVVVVIVIVVVVVSVTVVVSGTAVVVVFSVCVCVAFVCAAAIPKHSATANNQPNIAQR